MELGQRIAERYELEELIGKGAYASVYCAKDRASGARVALKIQHEASEDPQTAKRFAREAKLAGMLKGPHSVRVLDFGVVSDGRAFLVMELLRGPTLGDALASGPLGEARTVHVALQVLDALSEAHTLGFLHRDLKPDNVIVQPLAGGESVKVLDFGVAKIWSPTERLRETTKLTRAGATAGTPEYMSPEQCRGDVLTPASDVYSLAIMLYQCLTGRVPYSHPNPTEVMIMHHRCVMPALPKELAKTRIAKVIERCMKKDPAARYVSAAECREALLKPRRWPFG